MMLVLTNMVLCVEHLRFWENKEWIDPINPYGFFQWYLSEGDERLINRWQGILSRFKGKLVKTIKDVNLIIIQSQPKIRQILLHWGYELTNRFFIKSTN